MDAITSASALTTDRPRSFPQLRPIAVRLVRKWQAGARPSMVKERTYDAADCRRLYAADSVANRRFYNVGAGGFFDPCWTNLDYISAWYAGMQQGITPYDLTADGPLPIEGGTAEIIYTSHTIEHVTENAVERLFPKALEALKHGGAFRLSTGPDADLDFAALKRGDTDWSYWDDAPFVAHIKNIHLELPNTPHRGTLAASRRQPARS